MSTSFRLDAVKALVDVLCGLERQREKDTERDSESSGLSGEKEQALLHRILKLLQQSAASSSSSSSSSSSGGGGERVLLSREQELVLGLCHYVAHSSSGGRHVVLPAILPYVEHLLDYSYHIDATSTRQEIIQVDRFSFGLSVRLLQAAALSHLAAKDIIPAILTLLASFPKRIAAAANGTFLSNVKMGKYKMLITPSDLSSADPNRLATRILPALSGLLNAVIRSNYLWEGSFLTGQFSLAFEKKNFFICCFLFRLKKKLIFALFPDPFIQIWLPFCIA